MSSDYVVALQSLDRRHRVLQCPRTLPNGIVVTEELYRQADGTFTRHAFSSDPEDTDNFAIEPLRSDCLVRWLRNHWSDDVLHMSWLSR